VIGDKMESVTLPDVCYEVGFVNEDISSEGASVQGGEVGGVSVRRLSPESGSALKVCATASTRADGKGRNVSVLMYISRGFSVFVKFHSQVVLQDLAPFIIKYEGNFNLSILFILSHVFKILLRNVV